MADEKELRELCERIARLPAGAQLLVAESILAGLRKLHFTDEEAIRQDIAEAEAYYSQQRRTGLGEAKREAG
jgi:hypothetical protein